MPSRRYSGDVTVVVEYLPDGFYDVRVCLPGLPTVRQLTSMPVANAGPTSVRAIDIVARASLWFAELDGHPVTRFACVAGDGYYVSRTVDTAWYRPLGGSYAEAKEESGDTGVDHLHAKRSPCVRPAG